MRLVVPRSPDQLHAWSRATTALAAAPHGRVDIGGACLVAALAGERSHLHLDVGGCPRTYATRAELVADVEVRLPKQRVSLTDRRRGRAALSASAVPTWTSSAISGLAAVGDDGRDATAVGRGDDERQLCFRRAGRSRLDAATDRPDHDRMDRGARADMYSAIELFERGHPSEAFELLDLIALESTFVDRALAAECRDWQARVATDDLASFATAADCLNQSASLLTEICSDDRAAQARERARACKQSQAAYDPARPSSWFGRLRTIGRLLSAEHATRIVGMFKDGPIEVASLMEMAAGAPFELVDEYEVVEFALRDATSTNSVRRQSRYDAAFLSVLTDDDDTMVDRLVSLKVLVPPGSPVLVWQLGHGHFDEVHDAFARAVHGDAEGSVGWPTEDLLACAARAGLVGAEAWYTRQRVEFITSDALARWLGVQFDDVLRVVPATAHEVAAQLSEPVVTAVSAYLLARTE